MAVHQRLIYGLNKTSVLNRETQEIEIQQINKLSFFLSPGSKIHNVGFSAMSA